MGFLPFVMLCNASYLLLSLHLYYASYYPHVLTVGLVFILVYKLVLQEGWPWLESVIDQFNNAWPARPSRIYIWFYF